MGNTQRHGVCTQVVRTKRAWHVYRGRSFAWACTRAHARARGRDHGLCKRTAGPRCDPLSPYSRLCAAAWCTLLQSTLARGTTQPAQTRDRGPCRKEAAGRSPGSQACAWVRDCACMPMRGFTRARTHALRHTGTHTALCFSRALPFPPAPALNAAHTHTCLPDMNQTQHRGVRNEGAQGRNYCVR